MKMKIRVRLDELIEARGMERWFVEHRDASLIIGASRADNRRIIRCVGALIFDARQFAQVCHRPGRVGE